MYDRDSASIVLHFRHCKQNECAPTPSCTFEVDLTSIIYQPLQQKFRTGGSALRDPETLFPCFECVQGYEGSTLFFGLSHHDTKRPVTKLLSTNKIEQSGLSVNFEHFTNKISFELRSRGSGQGMPHPRPNSSMCIRQADSNSL